MNQVILSGHNLPLKDIYTWLEEHPSEGAVDIFYTPPETMDVDCGSHGIIPWVIGKPECRFVFENKDDMLLFKLTFGGK